MKKPVRVAVTGAAGHIGYALLFRIASGDMLGKDQPIILQLLEIPPAMKALEGVVMELNDCAFPLLKGIEAADDPEVAFKDAEYALLVGSRPRGPGMERKDLLQANGSIFTGQGKAISDRADPNVKVLVVGNPANTNCLIAMNNAKGLKPEQFAGMTRLDHNRAVSQLAAKTGADNDAIRRMIIWGNHSNTQVPDLSHATVDGKPAADLVDPAWVQDVFVPTVQKRGAEIINARGASSAASAANAAIDHMRTWVNGTAEGDWVSMSVVSHGEYGVAKGLVFSYPVTISGGVVRIVEGLERNEFILERTRTTHDELLEERAAIADLL